MSRPRRLLLVRIAFSIVCGILCLLLIVLWVRSYWWHDWLGGQLPRNRSFSLSAANGRLRYATFDRAYENSFSGERAPDWYVSTKRLSGPPHLTLVNTPLTEFALGFAGSSDKYGIVAVFPVWVPATVVALFAAGPWCRQMNWRFSLRTLLLATTLVAVVLGLAVAFR